MNEIIMNEIYEFTPIEAEEQGAFEETALTEEEAMQSLLDTIEEDTQDLDT